jgi:CRISPR-associated protein Csx14
MTAISLIATLGAEPQVISLATQLLLRNSEPLASVLVVHTRPSRPPVDGALAALRAAFARHADWPPLTTHMLPTDDVLTPAEIDAFERALFTLIRDELLRERRVHLLLAGGRKPMAMVGAGVAQMLLGPSDRLWYLYSDERLRQSGRLTLEAGDHAQLIAIPLPRQGDAPPHFTRAVRAETPADARRAIDAAREQRLRRFVETTLTPAERAVALMVARDVLTTREIAAQLHKSPKTVTNQLNSIYSKLESAFGLQPDKGVKREFLRRELRAYLG